MDIGIQQLFLVTKDANWDLKNIRKCDHVSLIPNPKKKKTILKLTNILIPHLSSDFALSSLVDISLFYLQQFLLIYLKICAEQV